MLGMLLVDGRPSGNLGAPGHPLGSCHRMFRDAGDTSAWTIPLYFSQRLLHSSLSSSASLPGAEYSCLPN